MDGEISKGLKKVKSLPYSLYGRFGSLVADYKELAKMPTLPIHDRKIVHKALLTLPSRINSAKEKEMGEMMGKLKEVGRWSSQELWRTYVDMLQLGNGILRPFGLSTDNFKMVKDEATGGYSMNFDQG